MSYASMENRGSGNKSSQQGRKMKRTELLEKKKVIEGAIKEAFSVKDHLALFPSFRRYSRNGLAVHFESGCGSKLSYSLKRHIQRLLKINMEGPYGSHWPAESKVKRREMVSPDARYVFVYEANASAAQMPMDVSSETNLSSTFVGFVQFRFILEEEVPVLYVYELQLEPRVQGKGLGKFLMLLIELIAHRNYMGGVVLTVQKSNKLAVNFYTKKLRYNISSISPSRVYPLIGFERSYEILCKTFNDEAKSILEGSA